MEKRKSIEVFSADYSEDKFELFFRFEYLDRVRLEFFRGGFFAFKSNLKNMNLKRFIFVCKMEVLWKR